MHISGSAFACSPFANCRIERMEWLVVSQFMTALAFLFTARLPVGNAEQMELTIRVMEYKINNP